MNRKCRVKSCGRPANVGLYCGRHKHREDSPTQPADVPDPRYD